MHHFFPVHRVTPSEKPRPTGLLHDLFISFLSAFEGFQLGEKI